jgi:alkylhydroperoxidase family enzyme
MTDDLAGWAGLSPPAARDLLPDALAAFDVVLSAVGTAADPPLLELVRRRIATLLQIPAELVAPLAPIDDAKLAALAQWPTDPVFSAVERVCLGFAEQFVIDVAGVTAADRASLTTALGDAGFGFVQALYVLDHGARLAVVLRQLFDGDIVIAGTDSRGVALWPALEQWMSAVARLHSVDPLTAELVRLRGARAHHCRLCSSRRRASAASENAALLEAADVMDRPDISPAQRVAVEFTDAVLLRPGTIPPTVLAAVRHSFTPQQAGEIAVLIAHNAANKIAVALGADQPTVDDGVEYFEVSPSGEYAYGVAAPG